jgi:CheY-like chemotaxis protein
MTTRERLYQQIADACEHLYDIAALRTHPLLHLTPPGPDLKARAWQLHRLLLKTIDDIAPGRDAPPSSREWRRHRLLQMRYVDVQSVQATAADLAVSRRQFYRIHDDAIAAVAALLFPDGLPPLPAPPDVIHDARSVLLRTEAARVPNRTYTVPVEVARKAAELLDPVCAERRVDIRIEDLDSMPTLAVDSALFRQLFLGIVDYLLERSSHTSIRIASQIDASSLPANHVRLSVLLSDAHASFDPERISALHEIAHACSVHLHVNDAPELGMRGFFIDAPVCDSCRTVLAVDDNEDMLQIYERYLTPHGFRVHTAHNAASALAALRHIRPEAVFLDVMLPGQDGWEVLQLMTHHPDAPPTKVFICSVLSQRELALALGADGYLRKPFTAADLLAALSA